MKLSLFLVSTIALMLSGCDFKPKDPARDYAQRLSNVLDVELEPLNANFPQFPSTSLLAIEEAKATISIREFLGLRQCKLHVVIAERNSLIGKVSSSSQRLKNDLQILKHGPACVPKIDNPNLSQKLQSYLAVKREQLPQRVWHAILGQDEYRQFWKQQPHNKEYPIQLTSGSILEDLSLISQFVKDTIEHHKYDFADEQRFQQVEQGLGRLRHGDAGQLLSELMRLKTSLDIADRTVESRLQRPLCLQPSPTTSAKHMQNVVTLYFAEPVQGWAISLNQRYLHLMPLITNLEDKLLPHSTQEFQQWVKQRNQVIESGRLATLNHAKRLQSLYQQCGLQAGNARRA
jgi:hypothetical protein